ncbi:MAG: ABC transporter substrate-binding protein [Armatimonadetes bacterium]|nr:ABC transporter substrate-binding protein [Armatimonadota bacterium]
MPIEVINALRQAGLAVIGKSPGTLRDVIEDIRDLGRYLGVEERADEIASDMEQRLEAVVQRGRRMFADGEGPDVLMIIGLEPVFVAGPGSFGDDMIRLCGARNVVAEDEGEQVSAWPQYSLERIVEHDPDIIISTLQSHEVGEGVTLQRLRELPGWRDLRAVEQGRVFDVDADLMLRTGPRLLDGLEAMARIIQGPPGGESGI